MTKLSSLAKLIRSKNAGPFQLTFDIMFDDDQSYRRSIASNAFEVEKIAARLRQPPETTRVFFCDAANAIKISIPRPYIQGDLRDSDGHGGQQYAPLLDIEIP